jgi:1,4-alpha-glucan branching enzyme
VCSRSRSDAASDLIVRAADVEALAQARHGDPFAVLGMHESDGALAVRAMLPGASAVDVVDAASGRVVATLASLHGAGVFGGRIPRRRKRFAYRLRVTWPGAIVDIEDPYRFAPLLGELDLWLFAEGTHTRLHDKLGAHRRVVEGVDGVSFAVWAPNATRVAVIGDFNAWDGRRHGMRLRRECGVWEIFLPGVADGARYKFEIKGPLGELLPAKADPFAFATELRPATASVVGPIPSPAGVAARPPALTPDAPVAIYEVHAGSWRRGPGGRFLGWHELADALLPYVLELGFTHVEFLPIMEHPFDGSWGYQPTGLYAPTARHGTPADFAALVARFHAAGVGVILDWVPGHFPSDAHGLAAFDGSHLYEHADPRQGLHRDWNTLIYNYGRPEVRNFLTANALFWLGRYGVAGLRVDAVASMLYLDYSRPPGAWIPNVHGGRENLEAVTFLRGTNAAVAAGHPHAAMIAEESTAWPGVSRSPETGGLGFQYKWNMGWMHDTLEYMRHDPVHRRHHQDALTFGLVYAWSENFVLPLSHDEVVHGKGSLLRKMPGDRWQRFANLRAYLGFMWAHPGKKLLFMGGEFGQDAEWDHDAELDWPALADPLHAGVQRLVGDLNRVYRNVRALHEWDAEPRGFEWIDYSDRDHSVVAFLRRGRRDDSSVVVVCNFTPVPHEGYRIGVPGPGRYREIVNTDAAWYGGSNQGNGGGVVAVPAPCHGRAYSLALTLPPLACIMFEWTAG